MCPSAAESASGRSAFHRGIYAGFSQNVWRPKVLGEESGGEPMSQLGKRYYCEVCGTEILCTKAGEGNPVCCEKEMQLKEPRPMPSSD